MRSVRGYIKLFLDSNRKPYSIGFREEDVERFYHTPFDSFIQPIKIDEREVPCVATLETFYLPDCTPFETISKIDVDGVTYERDV